MRHGWITLDEPVECLGRMVRSCREFGCYSATLGAFCVTHAQFIERTETTQRKAGG